MSRLLNSDWSIGAQQTFVTGISIAAFGGELLTEASAPDFGVPVESVADAEVSPLVHT